MSGARIEIEGDGVDELKRLAQARDEAEVELLMILRGKSQVADSIEDHWKHLCNFAE